MNRREIEARIRQMDWPTPSPDLRARVLSTAVVGGPRITWSDRLWFSRGWRLSAVAAALVVVAVEQVPAMRGATGADPAPPHALAQAHAVDRAAEQVGLPPDVANSFARRALAASSRPRTVARAGQAIQELEMGTAGGTE